MFIGISLRDIVSQQEIESIEQVMLTIKANYLLNTKYIFIVKAGNEYYLGGSFNNERQRKFIIKELNEKLAVNRHLFSTTKQDPQLYHFKDTDIVSV